MRRAQIPVPLDVFQRGSIGSREMRPDSKTSIMSV